MSALQRAIDARRGVTPAPRIVAPTPTPAPRITGQIPAGGLALSGAQPAFMTATPRTALQRAGDVIQTAVRNVHQGVITPGGDLDPARAARNIAAGAAGGGLIGAPLMGIGAVPGAVIGGVTGLAAEVMGMGRGVSPVYGRQQTPAEVAFRQDVPPPSQPTTITPQARTAPVPPAPTLPSDFQTRLATLPAQPTLAPGAFQAQAPVQAPATRAPIVTPATAPTPAMTPPAPFMMGGGGDRDAIMGGGINVPTETPLPPARVLPSDLGTEAPMGQFDAMIRALQAGQGIPTRYVPMPAVGVSPFGPAGAQERALRRLRDRELQRAF